MFCIVSRLHQKRPTAFSLADDLTATEGVLFVDTVPNVDGNNLGATYFIGTAPGLAAGPMVDYIAMPGTFALFADEGRRCASRRH